MPTGKRPFLHHIVERLGEVEAIDGPAEKVARSVRNAIPAGPVKDLISGTPLGHALHPLLTDLPIGTWTSALLLDLVGGRGARPAAQKLIGLGMLASLPTAATGVSDWADTTPADDGVRRIGAAHAVANVTALGCYAASLRARRRGRHAAGVALGLAGAGALAVGGHLGGHLSYGKAVGVDQTALDPSPEGWHDAMAEAELAEGGLHGVEVAGRRVLVVRHAGRVHALADRCSHRSGALSEGRLVDGCVECPLHGSRFALEDGSVERGPSAYPQPVHEARVRDGRVEVRLG